MAALSVKIDALQKQVSADSVDRALECVRQLAGRPVGISDGTAIVAALESLADVSRSAGHVDYKRHEAVLKQCRPLTHDPRLPAVVTQLLGDDENKKIAGQIQKILKSDHLFSAPQVHGSPFPAPAGVPGYLRQKGSGRGRYTYGYGSYNNNYASRGFNTTRCYNCRKTGHDIHKFTWESPNHRDRNQIDHMAINGRYRGSLLDTRAMRGADVGSDHHLVIAKLRLKLTDIEWLEPKGGQHMIQ